MNTLATLKTTAARLNRVHMKLTNALHEAKLQNKYTGEYEAQLKDVEDRLVEVSNQIKVEADYIHNANRPR